MTDELNRRNTAGVTAQLRAMSDRLHDVASRVDGFAASLAELHARIAALEQVEIQRKITAMGTGPTEK